MSENPSRAQQLIGDLAPKYVQVTDEVLFGDIWQREQLSPRDRSLITVSVLAALYRTEQLPGHLRKALDNGLTAEELGEALTHLAFYAGWPSASTGLLALKTLIDEQPSPTTS